VTGNLIFNKQKWTCHNHKPLPAHYGLVGSKKALKCNVDCIDILQIVKSIQVMVGKARKALVIPNSSQLLFFVPSLESEDDSDESDGNKAISKQLEGDIKTDCHQQQEDNGKAAISLSLLTSSAGHDEDWRKRVVLEAGQ
jgi:hypothetical protein